MGGAGRPVVDLAALVAICVAAAEWVCEAVRSVATSDEEVELGFPGSAPTSATRLSFRIR